jgi:hypothetical protein
MGERLSGLQTCQSRRSTCNFPGLLRYEVKSMLCMHLPFAIDGYENRWKCVVYTLPRSHDVTCSKPQQKTGMTCQSLHRPCATACTSTAPSNPATSHRCVTRPTERSSVSSPSPASATAQHAYDCAAHYAATTLSSTAHLPLHAPHLRLPPSPAVQALLSSWL